MSQLVADVMTPNPIMLDQSATLAEAAAVMRDAGVGDVMVLYHDDLTGIVTDRDITIRAVAAGRDIKSCMIGEIASQNVATVSPADPIEHAVDVMRMYAVRRLPVVDYHTRPVGIVSIGDLAVDRDPNSALADISASPATH